MNENKKLCIILTIVLLAVAFAGCMKEKPDSRTSGISLETEVNAHVSVDKNVDAGEQDEKAVVIKIVSNRLMSADIESEKIIAAIEKGMAGQSIEVKLEIVDLPVGNYSERLLSLLSRGELPDLIYFSEDTDIQFMEEGQLVDLTPYIEKSGYIKPLLEQQNWVRLGNYPYILNITQLSPNVPVIRTDWLNRLKSSVALLKEPTIENYYMFLKELKQRNLDGKGNPEVGITTDGYINELDAIFNMAFGITSTWTMDKNAGRYVYSRTTENEKKKLAFYRKLYKEDILGPKDKAKTAYNKLQLFYSGEAGVVCGAGWELNTYDWKMTQLYGKQAGITVLPPAKGLSQGYGPLGLLKEGNGFGISMDCRNKDAAFALLDFMAGPEGRKIDWLGIEGKHYEIRDDSIIVNLEHDDWHPVFWSNLRDLKFELPLSRPAVSEAMAAVSKMTQKWFTPDIYFLMYDMEDEYIEKDEYYKAWYYIEKLYADFSSDIITGQRNIEEFDDFVKRWYENGGEVITRYANRHIDVDKCTGNDAN